MMMKCKAESETDYKLWLEFCKDVLHLPVWELATNLVISCVVDESSNLVVGDCSNNKSNAVPGNSSSGSSDSSVPKHTPGIATAPAIRGYAKKG